MDFAKLGLDILDHHVPLFPGQGAGTGRLSHRCQVDGAPHPVLSRIHVVIKELVDHFAI